MEITTKRNYKFEGRKNKQLLEILFYKILNLRGQPDVISISKINFHLYVHTFMKILSFFHIKIHFCLKKWR